LFPAIKLVGDPFGRLSMGETDKTQLRVELSWMKAVMAAILYSSSKLLVFGSYHLRGSLRVQQRG
jgi:hypothetical protein